MPGSELEAKRLELLKEAFPGVTRVAVLLEVASPIKLTVLRALEPMGQELGVTLQLVEVHGPDDFERAFSAIAHGDAEALVVAAQPLLDRHAERIRDFGEYILVVETIDPPHALVISAFGNHTTGASTAHPLRVRSDWYRARALRRGHSAGVFSLGRNPRLPLAAGQHAGRDTYLARRDVTRDHDARAGVSAADGRDRTCAPGFATLLQALEIARRCHKGIVSIIWGTARMCSKRRRG